MKKAKIMLTAVGLLSVIGGALAFKAHRVSGKYFCTTTTTAATPVCNILATTAGVHTTFLYCTTQPLTTDCTKLINVRRNS